MYNCRPTFVTLREFGVNPLLMASTTSLLRTTPLTTSITIIYGRGLHRSNSVEETQISRMFPHISIEYSSSLSNVEAAL